ncbi:hypothetical protein HQ535_02730 [bacterium]|nr:hypothetical protein [bacterium]
MRLTHGNQASGRARRTLIGKILALAAALVLVAAACSDDGGTEADTLEPPGADVILRIVADGSVAADWTLADLEESVGFTESVIDGDNQTGPLFLDVLAASGVDDWDVAEVRGFGEGRTFEIGLDISADDVNETWILDVTNRGTLKLTSPDLPRESWVRDVGEIIID